MSQNPNALFVFYPCFRPSFSLMTGKCHLMSDVRCQMSGFNSRDNLVLPASPRESLRPRGQVLARPFGAMRVGRHDIFGVRSGCIPGARWCRRARDLRDCWGVGPMGRSGGTRGIGILLVLWMLTRIDRLDSRLDIYFSWLDRGGSLHTASVGSWNRLCFRRGIASSIHDMSFALAAWASSSPKAVHRSYWVLSTEPTVSDCNNRPPQWPRGQARLLAVLPPLLPPLRPPASCPS